VHMGRSWLCPPATALTVARNWVSSSGKLAVYSSFIMHMYSGLWTTYSTLACRRSQSMLCNRLLPATRKIHNDGRLTKKRQSRLLNPRKLPPYCLRKHPKQDLRKGYSEPHSRHGRGTRPTTTKLNGGKKESLNAISTYTTYCYH